AGETGRELPGCPARLSSLIIRHTRTPLFRFCLVLAASTRLLLVRWPALLTSARGMKQRAQMVQQQIRVVEAHAFAVRHVLKPSCPLLATPMTGMPDAQDIPVVARHALPPLPLRPRMCC